MVKVDILETMPRPSDEYLRQSGIDPADASGHDAVELAHLAWRERTDLWLRANSDPVEASEANLENWARVCKSEARSDDPIGARWWWDTHHLIAYGLDNAWLWRPHQDPPDYVLAAITAIPSSTVEGATRRAPPSGERLAPTALLPRHTAVYGMLAAVQARQGWQESSDGRPVYDWEKTDAHVRTSLQPREGSILTPDARTGLWAMAESLDDPDGDVFLAALAQAMSSEARQSDGSVWLSADAILDYRGILPKMHRRPAGGYRRAGHRFEDRAMISQSMERLDHLFVLVEERRSKRRVLRRESKVLVIQERWTQQTLDGSEDVALAWRYRIGNWLDEYLTEGAPHVAQLLRQALQYDPDRQKWEKRLARYIMLHGRMDVREHRPLTLSVGALLDETQLNEEFDTRHPSRDRKRFERALDQLRQDKVIFDVMDQDTVVATPAWQYTAEGHQVLQSLPRYDWVGRWREATIQLMLPKLDQELVRRHVIAPIPDKKV